MLWMLCVLTPDRKLMSRIRTYRELKRLETFEDRFRYLKLDGSIGDSTFGFDRWINQRFYRSQEWKNLRDFVIVRDNGCDLGIPGYEIQHGLLVHHMNPISVQDIAEFSDIALDPDYLITTSLRTHNAIHYGNEESLPREPVVRRAGDTTLWVK